MATKLKIKKGDKVVVITGKDKGKSGEVLKTFADENRVIVQGINVAKKHRKPSQAAPGGIDNVEGKIHVSNVALVDPKSGKPTRTGFKALADGRKVRVARRSGEAID